MCLNLQTHLGNLLVFLSGREGILVHSVHSLVLECRSHYIVFLDYMGY